MVSGDWLPAKPTNKDALVGAARRRHWDALAWRHFRFTPGGYTGFGFSLKSEHHYYANEGTVIGVHLRLNRMEVPGEEQHFYRP